MQSFRQFLQESGMIEDMPPNYQIQTWIQENRVSYHEEHGKDHGERILLAHAWKDYNRLNNKE